MCLVVCSPLIGCCTALAACLTCGFCCMCCGFCLPDDERHAASPFSSRVAAAPPHHLASIPMSMVTVIPPGPV